MHADDSACLDRICCVPDAMPLMQHFICASPALSLLSGDRISFRIALVHQRVRDRADEAHVDGFKEPGPQPCMSTR